MFPFGWGLSYTTFSYALVGPPLRSIALPPRGTPGSEVLLPLAVAVTNTGSRPGDCVVLVFLDGPPGGRQAQALVAFVRLPAIPPGAQRRAAFALTARDLARVDAAGGRGVAPGRLRLRAGDVVAPAELEVELTGAALELEAGPEGLF